MNGRDIKNFLFNTLRGRLILSVAVVHAVMMTVFIVDLTVRQRALLLDRQTEEAAALSGSLSTSAAVWIASEDLSGLQEIVESQNQYPELLFAMLTDDRGRVLAHTDKTKRGQFLLDLPREARQTILSRTPVLADVAVPAMLGGRHVGWARVGIGQKASGKKLAEITFSGALYAFAAIVLGSLIAWRMGRRITARLYAVQETIGRVRSGQHSARSSITGADEAASIATEFNVLLDTLDIQHAVIAASETKYRLLLRNIRAAVIVHGTDTRILMSNPMAQELLGLSEEQLLGKAAVDPAWHFVREDGSVMPSSEYPVNKTLAAKAPLNDLIAGVRRPDRDAITWVLVNTELVRNETGEPGEVIVTFVDITARKQAESALQRLNRELRAISNCNLALVRAEDEQSLLNEICRIVCDEAGYRMAWVGYAENDEARTVRPVAWAGVEDGYLASAKITWADTELGRGPTGIAIRVGEADYVQDFAIDSKAAPWRDRALQRGYRSSIALPLNDENKNTFGALTIYSIEANAFTANEVRILEDLANDLAFGITVLRGRSKRAEAERRLHREQAMLARTEAFAHIGSWEWEVATDTVTWSDELFRIFRRDPATGAPSFAEQPRLYHPEDMAKLEQVVRIAVLEGTPYELELRSIRTDGVMRVCLARGHAERGADGKAVRLFGSLQDITDRKRMEDDLRVLNEQLEQRVKERTAELEKRNRDLEQMNKAFVGRELRMVELKEKIKELEKQKEG
jgi:PAS domain S-box-containing protein